MSIGYEDTFESRWGGGGIATCKCSWYIADETLTLESAGLPYMTACRQSPGAAGDRGSIDQLSTNTQPKLH